MTSPTIAERLALVRTRIERAAQRADRDPASITLVAVTKTHSPEVIAEALAAGVTDLGENRVQEAAAKIPVLSSAYPGVRWHLIGHLQRNKAKLAVGLFDVIHSVDSVRLAETLNRHLQERAAAARMPLRRLPVLLQVNVSGEASKEGFELPGGVVNQAALADFLIQVESILALPALEVRGLMTIAPIVADPEQARPVFRALRELRDELARRFPQASWAELSMGMTDDFEAAIAEGATIVRVGRAIFGERSP